MSTAANLVEAILGDEDPKQFYRRIASELTGNEPVKAMCPFTSQGQTVAVPNFFSDEIGDWQPSWSEGTTFKLGEFLKNGVLDLNDLPFGTEELVRVNPDGSAGEKISFAQFRVIDTYQSQDPDANVDPLYPRE